MQQTRSRLALVCGLMAVAAASAWGQASTDSVEAEGIRFGTGASIGTVTEKMRITQDGLVGIGYQTPTTPLRVSGTAALDAALLIPRSVTSAQGGGGNYIASGTTSVSASSAGTIKFATSNSQRMVIDSSGNVGIGATSPGTNLELAGSGIPVFRMRDTDSSGAAAVVYMDWYDSSSRMGYFGYTGSTHSNIRLVNEIGALQFAAGGTGTILHIDTTGDVGIGTAAPSYQLQLSTNSAAKPTSNVWTVASDRRLKTDIKDFRDGLQKIQNIRPVTYRYNGRGGAGYNDKDEHIGIIAQEVQRVAPYMVDKFMGTIDGKPIELLNYDGHALPFILINAVKELKAESDNLRAEHASDIRALRTEIEALKKAPVR